MKKKIVKEQPEHLIISKETEQLAATTHFPSPMAKEKSKLTDEEKIDIIADRFYDIMEVLGLDLNDNSLCKTPYRVATMYVKEIFSGLNPENFPSITFIEDQFHHEHQANIVLVKVGFTSFCEHHFVPIYGTAYVAYLPNEKLIGLSKIPRIVRFFSRRPQVQERLSAQIADSLSIVLNTENVAVSLNAKHFCVIARGIEDEQSYTITNVLRGKFDTDPSLRQEFFASVQQ